jgi:hypothetical protein
MSREYAHLVFVYNPTACLLVFALVEPLVFYNLVHRNMFEPRCLR